MRARARDEPNAVLSDNNVKKEEQYYSSSAGGGDVALCFSSIIFSKNGES